MLLHRTITKQLHPFTPRKTSKQLFNASQRSLTQQTQNRPSPAPHSKGQQPTSIFGTQIQQLSSSTPRFTMSDPLPKRQKTSPALIGTHNGHFHADEALAVWFLRQLPTYKDSTLVRTRDQAILDTCHTVVDVGGEYSHEKNRYVLHSFLKSQLRSLRFWQELASTTKIARCRRIIKFAVVVAE